MKAKKFFKIAIIYVIFNLIFVPLSSVAILRYLPFDNIRKVLVSSLMTTLSHQSWAKFIATQDEIDAIVGKDKDTINIGTTDPNLVKNQHKNDPGISVYKIKYPSFNGYMIKVDDPSRIKAGISSHLPREGETVSSIATKENAIAAINAGGFTGHNYGSTGGKPTGIIIKNGVIKYEAPNVGSSVNLVGFTKYGTLVVGKQQVSQLSSMGIEQAVCFEPALITNGKPLISSGSTAGGIAPRSAIGQTRDGEVLMLVIDGRQIGSLGAYYVDIQNIMLRFGAFNASALDGGSSSTLYFNGNVINNPCEAVGERLVASAFVVK